MYIFLRTGNYPYYYQIWSGGVGVEVWVICPGVIMSGGKMSHNQVQDAIKNADKPAR